MVGNFWSHWKDFDTWKNGGKIQIFEQKWCFFRFYSRMSLPCKLLWTMLCCLMICIIYIHHLKNIFCNIWWHFFRIFNIGLKWSSHWSNKVYSGFWSFWGFSGTTVLNCLFGSKFLIFFNFFEIFEIFLNFFKRRVPEGHPPFEKI